MYLQIRFPLVAKHLRQKHPDMEHNCLACGQVLLLYISVLQVLNTDLIYTWSRHVTPGLSFVCTWNNTKILDLLTWLVTGTVHSVKHHSYPNIFRCGKVCLSQVLYVTISKHL